MTNNLAYMYNSLNGRRLNLIQFKETFKSNLTKNELETINEIIINLKSVSSSIRPRIFKQETEKSFIEWLRSSN